MRLEPKWQGDRAAKKTQGGPISLDVSRLRELLHEQSEDLLQRQKSMFDEAMSEMEARTEKRVGAVEATVATLTGQNEVLEGKVASLEKALQELTILVQKQGTVERVSPDESDRRRGTLIFGGWPKDSRRADILKEVADAIRGLGLTNEHDEQPFTTGPRRSVALLPMPCRSGESEQLRRARMYKFVQGFATATILSKFGGKLWCNFSKTQEERKVARHASWVKRAGAAFSEEKARDLLDVDYRTGTVWRPQKMIASAKTPLPADQESRHVWKISDDGMEMWVDMEEAGKLFECKPSRFKDALELGKKW